MQQENDDNTNETEAKPTITIAEKDGSDADEGEGTSSAKPTITIAEREGKE